MTSAASKVRFGHSVRPDQGENVEGMVRRVVELLRGTRALEPREPIETVVVTGAERVLGHQGRTLYAYVGDVHPRMGIIGLVLARDWPMSDVSKCDTGGLYAGMGDFAGAGEAPERVEALRRLNFAGPEAQAWSAEFESEVERLHEGIENYVRGVCPAPDKFAANDVRGLCVARGMLRGLGQVDRRLWTWEGRTGTPPRQEHYLLLVVSSIAQEALNQLAAEGLMDDLEVVIAYAPDDDSGIAGIWRRPEVLYRWLLGDEVTP